WRRVEPFVGRRASVLAGTADSNFKLRGPKAPVSAEGEIRGAPDRKSNVPRVGGGAGFTNVRVHLSGGGETYLPGTFTIASIGGRHQSGILIKGMRVRL